MLVFNCSLHEQRCASVVVVEVMKTLFNLNHSSCNELPIVVSPE
jgi:hypothetical protein